MQSAGCIVHLADQEANSSVRQYPPQKREFDFLWGGTDFGQKRPSSFTPASKGGRRPRPFELRGASSEEGCPHPDTRVLD